MDRPLIVTAEFRPTDLAWLDGLRRTYFPPERNVLNAHLTMFHALPPASKAEVRQLLAGLTARPAPVARIAEPYSLGRGVALRVVSAELEAIRDAIAERFFGLLSAQDGQRWRPHVTIQNKVTPAEAHTTLDEVAADFRPRDTHIAGLGLYRYAGGPWVAIRRFSFRG